MNKKYEIDIVTDTVTFENIMENLKKSVPGVKVLEIVMEGRGTGWPTIEIEIPNGSFDNLRMWYEGASSLEECELQNEDWRAMER